MFIVSGADLSVYLHRGSLPTVSRSNAQSNTVYSFLGAFVGSSPDPIVVYPFTIFGVCIRSRPFLFQSNAPWVPCCISLSGMCPFRPTLQNGRRGEPYMWGFMLLTVTKTEHNGRNREKGLHRDQNPRISAAIGNLMRMSNP